jgi:hypothetical protein
MNTQGQQFFSTRVFQIALLAALALALMVGAAYFFGTRLSAETEQSVAPSPLGSSLSNVRGSQSVAPSPLGSSLTNFRESPSVARSPLGSSLQAPRERLSEDYVGRLIRSSAAATSAVRAASRFADRYDRMSSSSAAATSAVRAASRFADRYDRMSSSSATARSASAETYGRLSWLSTRASSASAGLSNIEYARKFGRPAAAPARSTSPEAPSVVFDAALNKSLADAAQRRFEEWYGKPASTSPAVGSASLASLAERWAPFYAGLDKALTDAGARPAALSPSGMVMSSAESQSPWVKPEGTKPLEAAAAATDQSSWIKPEGITTK